MNHQMDNLSRLINKYANRFGEQDLLVLDLKKEMVIPPFSTGLKSRTVMQPWPNAALG